MMKTWYSKYRYQCFCKVLSKEHGKYCGFCYQCKKLHKDRVFFRDVGVMTRFTRIRHTLLQTDTRRTAAFTQSSFYQHMLLHREVCAQRNFYTQTPLHAEAFAQRCFSTQKRAFQPNLHCCCLNSCPSFCFLLITNLSWSPSQVLTPSKLAGTN